MDLKSDSQELNTLEELERERIAKLNAARRKVSFKNKSKPGKDSQDNENGDMEGGEKLKSYRAKTSTPALTTQTPRPVTPSVISSPQPNPILQPTLQPIHDHPSLSSSSSSSASIPSIPFSKRRDRQRTSFSTATTGHGFGSQSGFGMGLGPVGVASEMGALDLPAIPLNFSSSSSSSSSSWSSLGLKIAGNSLREDVRKPVSVKQRSPARGNELSSSSGELCEIVTEQTPMPSSRPFSFKSQKAIPSSSSTKGKGIEEDHCDEGAIRPTTSSMANEDLVHKRGHSRNGSMGLTPLMIQSHTNTNRTQGSINQLPSLHSTSIGSENTRPSESAIQGNGLVPGFSFTSTAAIPGSSSNSNINQIPGNRRRGHSRQISSVSMIGFKINNEGFAFPGGSNTNVMNGNAHGHGNGNVRKGVRGEESPSSSSNHSSSPQDWEFGFKLGSKERKVEDDKSTFEASKLLALDLSMDTPTQQTSQEPLLATIPDFSISSSPSLGYDEGGSQGFSFPAKFRDDGMRFGVNSTVISMFPSPLPDASPNSNPGSPGNSFGNPMVFPGGGGRRGSVSKERRKVRALFPGLTVKTDGLDVSQGQRGGVVVPELAIVPSTPLSENMTGGSSGKEEGFFLPPMLEESPTFDFEKEDEEGAGEGGMAKERFQSFSFGKASGSGLTSSTSSPAFFGNTGSEMLGEGINLKPMAATTPIIGGRKRHSHTRSSSISGNPFRVPEPSISSDLAALIGSRSLSCSPVSDISGDSPIDGLASEEQRRHALESLEGKRAALRLSTDWSTREREMMEQRNSWGNGRRRQRSSMAEKVEISLPSFEDEEDETPSTSSLSPSPISSPVRNALQAPSSPSRTIFEQGPSTTRKDSFGMIVPLSESPFMLGGLAASGGVTTTASIPTTLLTLMEEDEEEEEEEETKEEEQEDARAAEISDPIQPIQEVIMPPVTSANQLIATSPPPVGSKIRPLRLLSLSTVNTTGNSEVSLPGDTPSRRTSSIVSIDRQTKRSSCDSSTTFSPQRIEGFDEVNSIPERASRRGSFGYNPAPPMTDILESLGRREPRPNGKNHRWRGMSIGSTSSNTSFARKSDDVMDESDMPTPVMPTGISGWQGNANSKRQRKRHSISDSRSREASHESDNESEQTVLLNRLAETEEENQAMREDILGWQDRVRGLESQLEREREEGRLLRERVRKLGDHLSLLSSVNVPPSSPTSRASFESSDTFGPTNAALQTQLFALVTAVDVERKAKTAALKETAMLRAELDRERAIASGSEGSPEMKYAKGRGSVSFAHGFRPVSSRSSGDETAWEGRDTYRYSLQSETNSETSSEMPSRSVQPNPLHPIVEEEDSTDTNGSYPVFTIASAESPPREDAEPDVAVPMYQGLQIPVLLNDDGEPILVDSAPSTPGQDENVERLQAFAFPNGPVAKLDTPDIPLVLATPPLGDVVFNYGEEDAPSGNGYGHFGFSKFSAGNEHEVDHDLSFPPIEVGMSHFDSDETSSNLDFSRCCACCTGLVFEL